MTAPDNEFKVGDRITDRYEILAIVGRGRMGYVYKCRHNVLGRVVVVKTLQLEHDDNEDLIRNRFEREALLASKLEHYNVVGVSDFGYTLNGHPYLVMDYVEGVQLYDILAAEGQIQAEDAINLFIQVCDGLYYAHQRGVIHRDLKPANIIVTRNETVKVVELGVAKILQAGEDEVDTMAQASEIYGSPVYLSPEQCLYLELDNRTDIYSLGVCLYECLAGKPPFKAATDFDTLKMHVYDTPAPFSLAAPGAEIPKRLEEVVFRCLSKDPKNRYETMMQVKHELMRSRKSEIDSSSVNVAKQKSLSTVPEPKTTVSESLRSVKPSTGASPAGTGASPAGTGASPAGTGAESPAGLASSPTALAVQPHFHEATSPASLPTQELSIAGHHQVRAEIGLPALQLGQDTTPAGGQAAPGGMNFQTSNPTDTSKLALAGIAGISLDSADDKVTLQTSGAAQYQLATNLVSDDQESTVQAATKLIAPNELAAHQPSAHQPSANQPSANQPSANRPAANQGPPSNQRYKSTETPASRSQSIDANQNARSIAEGDRAGSRQFAHKQTNWSEPGNTLILFFSACAIVGLSMGIGFAAFVNKIKSTPSESQKSPDVESSQQVDSAANKAAHSKFFNQVSSKKAMQKSIGSANNKHTPSRNFTSSNSFGSQARNGRKSGISYEDGVNIIRHPDGRVEVYDNESEYTEPTGQSSANQGYNSTELDGDVTIRRHPDGRVEVYDH